MSAIVAARSSGRWATRRLPLRAAAAGAGMASVILGAWWIAAGTAAGPRWLELPTVLDPAWVQGPLRGITGELSEASLGTALGLLLLGYLAALAGARAVGLRVALTAVGLAVLAFTLGPSLVSSDAFGYVAYARELARHGLNPYVSAPAALHRDAILPFVYWRHQPNPYGPLFTLLTAPLGWLAPGAAVWVYKALAGLAAVLLSWLAADIARARGAIPARAAMFVGLNPVLLVYAVSGAHNDLLGAAFVAGAVWLLIRGRPGAAGAAAVGAAGIKLTLGLALPFVLLGARRHRPALRGAAVALLALGVPALILFGPHFADQLARIAGDPLFDTVWSGPDRLANLLGTSIDPAIRGACTALAAAAAIVMLARVRRGRDPVSAAGWALLALVAAIASLAPWYLVWVLPLAAAGESRRLRVAALAATVYLVAVHLYPLGGHLWLSQPANSVLASAAP